jgi:hypothetical protein
MSRKRSTFICPKCGKPGSLQRDWVRSSHYAVSPETTLAANGKWADVEEKDYETETIQTKRCFKIFSDKYSHNYVIHYDSKTHKRKKHYIDNIRKKEDDSSNPRAALVYAIMKHVKAIKGIQKKILKYPPTKPEDGKRLAQAFNEFTNMLDPNFKGPLPDWLKEVERIQQEHDKLLQQKREELISNNKEEEFENNPAVKKIILSKARELINAVPIYRELAYWYEHYVEPHLADRNNTLSDILSEKA